MILSTKVWERGMKKLLPLLVVLLVVLLGSACNNEETEGWIVLFDGETTSGWRSYNGTEFPESGWEVSDGMLVVLASDGEEEGGGGDIITEEQFDNFELMLEVKLSPEANSGIFYRAIESPYEPIWHNAPEFQVLDDTAYIEMGTMDMNTHLTGDNYDLHASEVTATKPLGEWNQIRIIVNGAHVEHWLNGTKTVEYELWSPEWEQLVEASKFADYPEYGRATSRHIGLQDHGHMLWYRNIKIRRIID